MTIKIIGAAQFMFLCCLVSSGQSLRHEIERITQDKQVAAGIALLYKGKTLTIGDEQKYPLMSTFKVHVAIAAMEKLEKDNISLEQVVKIPQNQIHINTYSPLRNKYPAQDAALSYRDIIRYTVAFSDNNTCDFLIRFAGGINAIDRFIKSQGIKNAGLTATEHDMQKNIQLSYNNWSTPLAMVQLLKRVYDGNILSTEHFAFLEECMLASVGNSKLKAGLPAGIKIAHKTGHSKRLPSGTLIADTDAGVVYMPDGEKCYIAVFIKDSREPDNVNADIIADIMSAVYKFLSKRRSL